MLHISFQVTDRPNYFESAVFISLAYYMLAKRLTVHNLLIFTASSCVVPCSERKT